MLSRDAYSIADVNSCVEFFIPMIVGRLTLLEAVECNFLLVHRSIRVLVICLCIHCLLNQSHESKWIVGFTARDPICIMFHSVQQHLLTLATN